LGIINIYYHVAERNEQQKRREFSKSMSGKSTFYCSRNAELLSNKNARTENKASTERRTKSRKFQGVFYLNGDDDDDVVDVTTP